MHWLGLEDCHGLSPLSLTPAAGRCGLSGRRGFGRDHHRMVYPPATLQRAPWLSHPAAGRDNAGDVKGRRSSYVVLVARCLSHPTLQLQRWELHSDVLPPPSCPVSPALQPYLGIRYYIEKKSDPTSDFEKLVVSLQPAHSIMHSMVSMCLSLGFLLPAYLHMHGQFVIYPNACVVPCRAR